MVLYTLESAFHRPSTNSIAESRKSSIMSPPPIVGLNSHKSTPNQCAHNPLSRRPRPTDSFHHHPTPKPTIQLQDQPRTERQFNSFPSRSSSLRLRRASHSVSPVWIKNQSQMTLLLCQPFRPRPCRPNAKSGTQPTWRQKRI